MEISVLLELVGTFFSTLLAEFDEITSMILTNNILLVPVLISFFGSIILFSASLLKRFGIRGVSSTGRRRRR